MKLSDVRRFAMPLLGMSLFWTYFRYQSFFGVLYPYDSGFTLLGGSIALYPFFLMVLFIISLVTLAFVRQVEKLLSSHRTWVPLVTLLGSIGVLLGTLTSEGLLDERAFILSIVLVTTSFVLLYMSWATFFSSGFDKEKLVLLAGAYLLSLLLPQAFRLVQLDWQLAMISIPFCSGIFWFLSEKTSSQAKDTKLNSLASINLYIILFIVFLLAGSIIRGLVDVATSDAQDLLFRRNLSIVVAALALAACLFHSYSRKKVESEKTSTSDYLHVERLTLLCWIALALFFFLGLFICLVPAFYPLGGQVVVVARSTLDLFLWILLCNFSNYKKISPVLLFLVCSLFTEIASWALSYIIIPHLLVLDLTLGATVPEILIPLVVFTLTSSLIVLFGITSVKKRISHDISQQIMTVMPDKLPEQKIKEYRLTNREVDVMLLFSRGHSLHKTASALYISTSTAQSHIKSIYRKCGIHSRDELIDLVDSWNSLDEEPKN